ncbi:MAG: DNA repair exonuclease [Tissierellia bacterium]|nr:DNA repair exonuclease [Tissierellia bacterium]
MKFLHTADLHLGNSFPSEDPQRRSRYRRLRFQALEDISSAAVAHGVDYLFLVGDIFEEQKISHREVVEVMERLNRLPVKVFLLLGNHDYGLFDTLEAIKGKVHLFGPQSSVYVDHGRRVMIFGESWSRHSYGKEKLIDPSVFLEGYTKILLHHGTWGGRGYFPLDPATFSGVFDYIALGHIHKGEELQSHVVMCGTPEILSFDEVGDFGYILGEGEGAITTRRISRSSLQVERVSLHSPEELEELEQSPHLLYDIHYDGVPSDYLRSLIQGNFPDSRVKFLPKSRFNYRELYGRHRDDVVGAFIRKVRAMEGSEEYLEQLMDVGLSALMGGRDD